MIGKFPFEKYNIDENALKLGPQRRLNNQQTDLETFKRMLKTYLFSNAYE